MATFVFQLKKFTFAHIFLVFWNSWYALTKKSYFFNSLCTLSVIFTTTQSTHVHSCNKHNICPGKKKTCERMNEKKKKIEKKFCKTQPWNLQQTAALLKKKKNRYAERKKKKTRKSLK